MLMRYSDLTSEQASRELAERILLLPIGAVEQHGPHLPLSVDVDIAVAIVESVANAVDGLVAPSIAYAARSLPQSGGGHVFPGTIHVPAPTFVPYLEAAIAGFVAWGARRIAIINGHFENEAFVFEALEMAREQGKLSDVKALALSWWSVVDATFIRAHLGHQFLGWHAEHAGIVETSMMMHLRPELVRDMRVDNPRPPAVGVYRHPPPVEATAFRGVLSSTSGSSAQLGKLFFEHACDQIIATMKELR